MKRYIIFNVTNRRDFISFSLSFPAQEHHPGEVKHPMDFSGQNVKFRWNGSNISMVVSSWGSAQEQESSLCCSAALYIGFFWLFESGLSSYLSFLCPTLLVGSLGRDLFENTQLFITCPSITQLWHEPGAHVPPLVRVLGSWQFAPRRTSTFLPIFGTHMLL